MVCLEVAVKIRGRARQRSEGRHAMSDQGGPQFLLQVVAFVERGTGLAGELPGMEPDGRSGVAGIDNRFVDLRRHASD